MVGSALSCASENVANRRTNDRQESRTLRIFTLDGALERTLEERHGKGARRFRKAAGKEWRGLAEDFRAFTWGCGLDSGNARCARGDLKGDGIRKSAPARTHGKAERFSASITSD